VSLPGSGAPVSARIERARRAAEVALVSVGLRSADAVGAGSATSDDGGAELRVVRAGTAVLLAAPHEGVLVRVDDRVGGARAARHLAVGHALARLGVPAVRPLPGLDAPVEVDGSAVTVWKLERLVRAQASPAQVGHLAGRLHRATRDGVGWEGLDTFDPLRDVTEQLAIAELAGGEAALLDEVVADVARRWAAAVATEHGRSVDGSVVGPWGIVHGDLHAGNVLVTRRGPVLADLELAGVGPVAYDLVAPVVAVLRYDAPVSTLVAYQRAYRAPVPPAARHGVLRDAYELWLTSWALANRHLDGAHALEATRRLDRWRRPRRAAGWSLR
jgi:hypothetical protein